MLHYTTVSLEAFWTAESLLELFCSTLHPLQQLLSLTDCTLCIAHFWLDIFSPPYQYYPLLYLNSIYNESSIFGLDMRVKIDTDKYTCTTGNFTVFLHHDHTILLSKAWYIRSAKVSISFAFAYFRIQKLAYSMLKKVFCNFAILK